MSFEQTSHIFVILFTQELDYKAKYTALTALKITSILSQMLKTWSSLFVAYPSDLEGKKTQIYISNKLNLQYHSKVGWQSRLETVSSSVKAWTLRHVSKVRIKSSTLNYLLFYCLSVHLQFCHHLSKRGVL